jgi:hypothetical protein
MKRCILVSAMVVAFGYTVFLSGVVLAGCYPDNTNPPCEGNFDYNCTVDGLDAAKFKSDFGRSGIKNPCPSAGPALVPKTGQTTSYATGDDGELKKGVAWPNPRFTDNGDGTVTDNLTGLIWLKNANCTSFFSSDITGQNNRTWNDALYAANNLASGYCGLTDDSIAGDWRLPNKNELNSLVDVRYNDPSLCNTTGTGQWTNNDPFTDVQFIDYWTSTTDSRNSGYAYDVHMNAGGVVCNAKTITWYVWPVRGVCT